MFTLLCICVRIFVSTAWSSFSRSLQAVHQLLGSPSGTTLTTLTHGRDTHSDISYSQARTLHNDTLHNDFLSVHLNELGRLFQHTQRCSLSTCGFQKSLLMGITSCHPARPDMACSSKMPCSSTPTSVCTVGRPKCACDALDGVARMVNPRAVVWKGSQLPAHEQGIKVPGTPFGHPAFVAAHLERTTAEHQALLDRVPTSQMSSPSGCSSAAPQPEETSCCGWWP